MIEGDSGEYEFLTEAVELSKDVEGMCIEIGLRLGLGTKTIIDACVTHRPRTTVISIDPFGSILYQGREHMPPCRLDYTNDMYKQVMSDMSGYVLDKNVNWLMFKMTDIRFFSIANYGVELYDLEPKIVEMYAMAHLDGPHSGWALIEQCAWFSSRMKIGSTIVIDDISEDFCDIKPIQRWFKSHNWEEIKLGLKKGIWQKK